MTRRRNPHRAPLYDNPAYAELRAIVARNLKRLRRSRGITQEELAESAAMAPRQVQAAEAGEANLTLLTLARMAEGLETDVEAIVCMSRRRRQG